MRRDLFAAVPTTLRLWAAVALAVAVPTADRLSGSYGYLSPGFTLSGDCGYSDGPYCTPDTYIPGSYTPGTLTSTSQAQLRLLVWASVIALALVAARRRTATTRRVARLATLGLTGALAVGLAERSAVVVLLLTVTLLLVAPPAWRRLPSGPAAPGRFGSWPARG